MLASFTHYEVQINAIWLIYVAQRSCATTHPWTHYLPTGLDNLPAATAHTNTRL